MQRYPARLQAFTEPSREPHRMAHAHAEAVGLRRGHRQGGGYGLATAYLAKEQRISNVAVVEVRWLGGVATARSVFTIVRSNYLWIRACCSTNTR